MPIIINTVEHIDSLWTFGGGFCGLNASSTSSNSSSNALSSSQTTNSIRNSLMSKSFGNNRGSTDKDFNMPISVRCCDKLIYVLDSGNNRIKVLNLNGNFIRRFFASPGIRTHYVPTKVILFNCSVLWGQPNGSALCFALQCLV